MPATTNAARTIPNTAIVVGDRVQGGKPGTEDHDTGRVVSIEDDGSLTVAWDSGIVTEGNRGLSHE
jgi:hypothetical protein